MTGASDRVPAKARSKQRLWCFQHRIHCSQKRIGTLSSPWKADGPGSPDRATGKAHLRSTERTEHRPAPRHLGRGCSNTRPRGKGGAGPGAPPASGPEVTRRRGAAADERARRTLSTRPPIQAADASRATGDARDGFQAPAPFSRRPRSSARRKPAPAAAGRSLDGAVQGGARRRAARGASGPPGGLTCRRGPCGAASRLWLSFRGHTVFQARKDARWPSSLTLCRPRVLPATRPRSARTCRPRTVNTQAALPPPS